MALLCEGFCPGRIDGFQSASKRSCSMEVADCCPFQCAVKSPRMLSGSLATTTQGGIGFHDSSQRLYGMGKRKTTSVRWSDEIAIGVYGLMRAGLGRRRGMIRLSGGHSLSPGCCAASQGSQLAADNQGTGTDYSYITPAYLWENLFPTVSYLSHLQLETVKHALQVAFDAHDGQKRKSGEPYIIHPVEVARILGELEMDWETIVAGLLHDTVEDTNRVTFEQIEDMYGSVVRRIVEGETKVSKLGKMNCQDSSALKHDVKADDLRQMFLAMTEEVRVIIVKLADRLHNMRTLSHMPPHKQKHIAMETLQVFAPLAKLLGIYRIKSELEDLSFMYAYPEQYSLFKRRIDSLCKEQEDVVIEAKKILLRTIEKDKFLDLTTCAAKVLMFCKEPYSIHKKILESKGSVEEVRDISQIRVVLKMKPGALAGDVCNVQQVCYHVMGLVHAMWPPVPGSVKDYIATPKPNGYQSLHTTVLPLRARMLFPLEIQIRTEEMDRLAEWGIAAHHSGRESSFGSDKDRSNGSYLATAPQAGLGAVVGSSPESSNSTSPQNDGSATSGGGGGLVPVVASGLGGAPSPALNPSAGLNGAAASNGSFSSAANDDQSGVGGKERNGAVSHRRPAPSLGWSKCLNDTEIARCISWLNSIREWQEEFVGNMTAREFVDTITGDLLGSRVFVFTPKGEVKNLPKGATVIDYAYHIHTDVGNKMVAAKVNGNLVSPTHALSNAEVVEILTYDGVSERKAFDLHQQWLPHARTRSARHKLTKFLKDQAAASAMAITDEKLQLFLTDDSDLSDSEWMPYSTSDSLGAGDRLYSNGSATTSDSANSSNSSLRPPNFNGATHGNASSSGRTYVEPYPGEAWRYPSRPTYDTDLGSDAGQSPPKANGKHRAEAERLGKTVEWDPGQGSRTNGQSGRSRDYGLTDEFGNVIGNGVESQRAYFGAGGRVRPVWGPAVEKVMASYNLWQVQMIALWHSTNGRTVQWLCVKNYDRNGLLAEVSSLLTQAGFNITTHAGRTDRNLGVGIMLFEFKGNIDLEDECERLCSKVASVEGVLTYAIGCTWQREDI